MLLTDDQRAIIADALRIAVGTYNKDAAQLHKAGQHRLTEVLHEKCVQVNKLARMIEDAKMMEIR